MEKTLTEILQERIQGVRGEVNAIYDLVMKMNAQDPQNREAYAQLLAHVRNINARLTSL